MSSGRYELIGAVSWGRNCAKSFGVYADIPCKISHFHLLDKHNIRIHIRSFLGNQMIFVFIFGHQNTIRSPLISYWLGPEEPYGLLPETAVSSALVLWWENSETTEGWNSPKCSRNRCLSRKVHR